MNTFKLYGAGGYAKVIIEILEKSENLINELYQGSHDIDILFDYPVSNSSNFFDLKGFVDFSNGH